MTLDTSALIAVLFSEPGYLDVVDRILEADIVRVGAPTLVETSLVFAGRRGRRPAGNSRRSSRNSISPSSRSVKPNGAAPPMPSRATAAAVTKPPSISGTARRTRRRPPLQIRCCTWATTSATRTCRPRADAAPDRCVSIPSHRGLTPGTQTGVFPTWHRVRASRSAPRLRREVRGAPARSSGGSPGNARSRSA